MLIRKVVLMIALGLTCSSAMAEWKKAGTSGNMVVYADLGNILRKGSAAKIWFIFDYKVPQTLEGGNDAPYLSIKGQMEANCGEEQIRLLAMSVHKANMGAGSIIFSDYSIKEDFEAVAPDSNYRMLYKRACTKQSLWEKN